MAILDLPESILQSLSSVLTQLQQVLPPPKQPTDFSAIAFRWENQQLVAIQQPKKLYLEDLKGIERQKAKIIQNTLQFLNRFLPMMFYSQVHVVQGNHRLFAPCLQSIQHKVCV